MRHPEGISTRKQVMQLLKTNGELSAKDLTEYLHITGMAVRRHLDTLERDGLIESRAVRQPMGRPMALYRLTPMADDHFPKKYDAIALDLLGELAQEAGSDMVNHLFDRRKETLYNKYAPAIENREWQDQVETLAQIQHDNGYMVELEQVDDDEFVLKEYNCPIAQIANQYNHACQCELGLFERLLNADVSRHECLASGGQKCAYVIKKRDQAE